MVESAESARTTERPRSKLKQRLFAATALLLSVVVIESVSYVILRAFASQPDVYYSESALFDAHRNHRLNPDFRLSHEDTAREIHSSDGFRRDTPVSLEKPADTVRVIVLGTSALYGAGAYGEYPTQPALLNDETITGVLEQSINQRLRMNHPSHSVEVINAGVPAYHTFHELVYLNSKLLAYEPDIVINIDGHNDFYRTEPYDRWGEYAYSTSVLVDQYNGRSFFLPWQTAVRSVAPYSNFFNLLEKANKRVWYLRMVERPLPNTPHFDMQALEDFDANFRQIARQGFLRDLWQIHQLGERESFDHCVFLQPEVLFEKASELTDADREIQDITLDLQPEGTQEQMRRIRAMLPDLFEQEEVPFHDIAELAPHNDKGETLYIDYCHLSPAGARVVAGQIELVIYPMVVKRISAAPPSPAMPIR